MQSKNLPTILVIDDDHISRLFLQSILQKEGFVVLSAVNGLEGRMAADREQPDLIIMDILMPEEDGLTACAALKSNVRTSPIPVIFISAIEDVDSKINGFNVGGVDYITKPFNALEVVARVRLHIRLYHSYRNMVSASLEQLKNLNDSQRNILTQPEEFPEAGFSVFYLPAQTAGGDFYDVVRAGAGIYDYLVADVSGHHTGTALPAAALKALLRQNISMLYSPLENLTLINRHLRPVLQEGQYATLIYARLNKSRMCLTLANAGHPPAIIARKNGEVEVVKQSGDGLGLFDSVSFEINEIPVVKGDRVFLFSDGLLEEDSHGTIPRRIGLANLIGWIKETSSSPVETIVMTFRERLIPGSFIMTDDTVLLGFEVN